MTVSDAVTDWSLSRHRFGLPSLARCRTATPLCGSGVLASTKPHTVSPASLGRSGAVQSYNAVPSSSIAAPASPHGGWYGMAGVTAVGVVGSAAIRGEQRRRRCLVFLGEATNTFPTMSASRGLPSVDQMKKQTNDRKHTRHRRTGNT
jgi:hypothetical protein